MEILGKTSDWKNNITTRTAYGLELNFQTK